MREAVPGAAARYATNGDVRIAYEDMTDDAVAVLDAVGWDSAHVYGHSLGGVLAQRIALRHPGRVRSLTSGGALPSDATGLAVYRATASPGYPRDEAAARESIELDLAHGCMSFRDVPAQARQSSAAWHGGRLSHLRVPALVLHGADDQVLRPAAARRIAASIDGARLRVFPGVGHYLPRELWPVLAGEIRAL